MKSEVLRAFFLNDAVLVADAARQEEIISRGKDLGFNAVVVETMRDLTDFSDRCRRGELRLIASIPCFSDHLDLAESDWIRPRFFDGQLRGKMEWYLGISPLDQRRLGAVEERIKDLINSGVSSLALDFIRWPVHWEIEFRNEGDAPLPADFGVGTDDLSTRTKIRYDTISQHVKTLTNYAKRMNPDVWIGAFVVPVDGQKQQDVTGQDPVALGGIVDSLIVMSYHGILGRDPAWVASYNENLAEKIHLPIIPMVQVTADEAYTGGWDWGKPISATEGVSIAKALHGIGLKDIVVFPGEAVIDGSVFWDLTELGSGL